MNVKRLLPLALALLALVGFVAVGASADDKPGDKADKTTTTKGMGSYSGKIVSVNADKMSIVLGDVMRGGDKGTGTGTGAATGAGAGAGDTGRAGEKGKAGGDRTMTFMVTDKARVSLDGKDAKFADLRAGLFARVSTDRSGSGTGSGAGKGDRAGTDTGKGDAGKGTGTAGRMMTASRVEAFTKAPSGTGTGREKTSGGTDR